MEGVKDPLTPSRASYHHGDLRRTLLETALRLIAERGPEGFSLREAAREVSVSPAAAYRHFADKPALLAALAADGHGRLASEMEKAAARTGSVEPAPARAVRTLLAIGQAYVDFAVRNPSFFRVMFGTSLLVEGFVPCCGPSGRDSYQILADTLDQLVATGAIPPDRRPGAEVVVWSAVHGFSTLVVDGALQLTPRQRAAGFRVLARGLLRSLGCEEALLPSAPALGRGIHPERHPPVGAAGPPR
jgi:AcrR family transcriptional regulator